jgi:hypothetical protein
MDTRLIDPTPRYAEIVLAFLREYAEEMYGEDPSPLETQIIADQAGHHYQLLRVGWAHGRFMHSCRFHFDVKQGKVWIQINHTEEMIGDELVKRGIPAEDIVLAFHPPEVRQHTGFGIG